MSSCYVQRWKPHVDVYIIPPPYQRAYCLKPKRAVYNTPCRASPLLCSWHSVWSCEVLTRQNQSVQLRLNMYMLPWPPAFLWAFSKGYDCKDSDNFDKLYQKMEIFFMNAKLFRFLFVFVGFCKTFRHSSTWCNLDTLLIFSAISIFSDRNIRFFRLFLYLCRWYAVLGDELAWLLLNAALFH